MMNIVQGAVRVVTGAAEATTAVAGAAGGAVVNGVIGGVKGSAAGLRNGLSNGSHSTSAAALTFAVIGAAGLVEWPVLLAVGGTALLVSQLNRQANSDGQAGPESTASEPVPPSTRTAARKSTRPRKAPVK